MTMGPETGMDVAGAKRRPWWAIAGLGALAVIVACFLLLGAPASSRSLVHQPKLRHKPPAGTHTKLRQKPPAGTRTATAQWNPVSGVYAGPGAVASAQAFAVQLGGPVPYALDFFNSGTWASISDPQWAISQWKVSRFHMIYGVPMLPESGASLATGATGAYDPEFTALATQLVAAGEGNAVLMIGWNPLQSGNTWQVNSQAAATAYVSYWRHIVESVRAVPGANFQFEWDGGTPDGSLTASSVYPGDAYVNLIATNAFDRLTTPPGGSRWYATAQGANGPDWFSQFAADHHKPLVIGEWGLVPASTPGGGGDDVAFVRDFTQWCGTNHVALVVTWDYGTWGLLSGSFPASEAALAKAGRSEDSTLAVQALEGQRPGT
jgi:hypothetical protein